MAARTIALLHVEDDPMQQRMIAHHLQAMPEYNFVITAVMTEELAMQFFQHTRFQLVMLDYQLVQGDGMHLLWRMRELDPIIPIIAVSGVATSEIAAQLVLAGADDYFDKRELNSARLAKSIRSCLLRASTVRQQLASRMTDKLTRFTNPLLELCALYVRGMDAALLTQLDAIAHDMKRDRISAQELQQMHANATARLDVPVGLDLDRLKLLTRPLLLELLVRVCDDSVPAEERKA